MDSEKGALLSWLGLVFMERGAVDNQNPRPWLPDLPNLANVLQSSDTFVLTEQCNREIRLLGSAANLTFTEYLANYHTPVQHVGSAANPIVVDEYNDATSVLDSSPTSLFYTKSITTESTGVRVVVSQGADDEQEGEVNSAKGPRCPAGALKRRSLSVDEQLDELALESLVLSDLDEESVPEDYVDSKGRGAVTRPGDIEDESLQLSEMLATVTIQHSADAAIGGQGSGGHDPDSHMYSPPRRD